MSAVTPAAPDSSLLAASLALLPPAHRSLLQRYALVGSLDEAIARELGRDLVPAADTTLAELAEYPFIARLPDRPGRYRIRDDVRRKLIESWWDGQPLDRVPAGLAKLSADLAGRLEQVASADRGDVVALRLFAAPKDGLKEWRDLYGEADRRFDLAQCRSLIATLGWIAAVSPTVERTREKYQTDVEARSLWMDDWYRTESFLLPAVSRTAFRSLMGDGRGRMLEIRGRGGYGKTMHIRWLVARNCVVAQPRVPCARIDFQVVDPLAAACEPHLALLEMADQLDRQMPGDAFGKLVRTYSADRARLYRRKPATGPDREVAEPAAAETRLDAADDVRRRFAGRLAELPPNQPVVLILDTLEVALHLPDTAEGPTIKPLLAALAEVQRQATSVRVVLAGRYELSQTLRELFPDRCEPFALPAFSADEAAMYLRDKRRIRRPDLVRVAVRASRRVPFSLALLADLIDANPGISPRTIAEYRGAEYAYLIEKVVKQISEQPVRWLLRYAAIPRRFDYDFVSQVLWPRACQEMSGTGGQDDPAQDDLGRKGESKALWRVGAPGPAQAQPVREIWAQVRRYANGSSWISPDDRDPDALRLQPEVIRPLRELLRTQPIFRAVHADAARYFLDRADEPAEPGSALGPGFHPRRAEFLREAVFHRFESEGAAAADWWEGQIRAAHGPADRLALADELAHGPEYADSDGHPPDGADLGDRLPPGDSTGPLVPEPTLQLARLEYCLACAELATLQASLTSQDPLWRDARLALELLDGSAVDTLAGARVALARAAVAIGTGQAANLAGRQAGNLADALHGPGPSPRERLWLATLDAVRLVAEGSADADARLADARQIEREATAECDVRRLLASAAVRRLRDRGALTEAAAACAEAVTEGLGGAEFRLAEARIRLAMGDSERALAMAEAVAAESPALAPFAQVLAARCRRRQYRFGAATASVRRVLIAQEEARGSARQAILVRAQANFEYGEIAAKLLQVAEARTAYAEASRLFSEAGDPASTAGCHVQEARLLLNGLGHLRAAGVALDYAERAAPPASNSALLAQLTRAELVYYLGRRAEAEQILDEVMSVGPRAGLPIRMAATAVAGLAFGRWRDQDRYIGQLTEALPQVTPPTARLQLLSKIIRCPLLKPQSKAVRDLRAAVVPGGGWEAEFAGLAVADRIILRLRAGALARILGDSDEADSMLGSALQEAPGCGEPLSLLLSALRLARLLRSASLTSEAARQALAILPDQAVRYPMLAAVTVIEYLEAIRDSPVAPIEDPAVLLRRAEAWLGWGGSSTEAWRARLFRLYPAIIGDVAPAPYLKTAAQQYDAAGDVQAAEGIQSGAPELGLRVGPDTSTIVVNVTLNQAVIKTKVVGWRFRLPRRREAATAKVRDMISNWVRASGGGSPYPPGLPDMMVGQWPEFTEAMAVLLDGAEVITRRRRAAQAPNLAACINDGVLQPLPWELAAGLAPDQPLFAGFQRAYRQSAHAAADIRLVRLVQAGLKLTDAKVEVDGVSGPNTARALQAFRVHADVPSTAEDPATVQRLHQDLLRVHGARPTVIIVRSAPGPARRRSLALERRYDLAGFGTSSIDQAHLPALPLLLGGDPAPVIVHVVGGLVAVAGTTAVDLQDDSGGWGSPDESGLLTSADLDQALRAVPPDWPAPVVVLDVPVPTGRREIADQLLLRNCFGADLFAMGGARAVLGIGLARREAADAVQGEMIGGFARGHAVGDVVQDMRRQASPTDFGRFDTAVAFAATALWSDDPSMRLPTLAAI